MELLEQLTAVAGVLALLGATLWWLRARGAARFAPLATRKFGRRLQAVERLPLGPQHTLHLVRVSGRSLLIATSPSGCTLLEASEWRETEAEVVR
jgi:flagellar biogenesis protein FliO